jgi:hypothetical protein
MDIALKKTYAGLERNFELLWGLIEDPKGTCDTAVRIATGERSTGGVVRRCPSNAR